MKKIIAIALVLVFALAAVVSCDRGGSSDNGGASDIEKIAALYAASVPTKSVTTTTYEFSNRKLTDTATLVTGVIDGEYDATVLTETTERIRDIDSGSGDRVQGVIESSTKVTEYLEGSGVRVDGGAWNVTGANFAPTADSIALKLTAETVKDLKLDGKTYTFTITKTNTEAVLGYAVDAPVYVTLVHDGASVVGVTLSYTLPADAATGTIETDVTIKIVYTYDIERVSIG